MALFDNNHHTFGPTLLDVLVSTEDDDGAFLNVTIRDYNADRELLDLVATDPGAIQAFFDAVDEARRVYLAAKA